jgi:hypothetical protein
MRPETGLKHDWINPRVLGYTNLGDFESCRKCGVVRNDKIENVPNCPGIVKIALR